MDVEPMNKIVLYDSQHYIDREYGGGADGTPIDCSFFTELVVSVRWKTAGGNGMVRVRVFGSNVDQDAHQLLCPLPPQPSASYNTRVGDCEVQQDGLYGQLVAVWRGLPKWCAARIDCGASGISGEGSSLRVAVLGR